jgi:hypothetical protein
LPSRLAIAAIVVLATLTADPRLAAAMEAGPAEGPGQTGYPVRTGHFLADICSIIDRESVRHALPRAFVARLIRVESRFRAGAVSPKGAMGIAQFMPGTARLRGLDDPYNSAAAVPAAIRYLAELRDRFGNLGLAAAAYNAGEARVAAWLAGDGGLPAETRDYVRRITGRAATDWTGRGDRKDEIAPIGTGAFAEACVKFAAGGGPAPTVGAAVGAAAHPWGAQVAQARSRELALALFDRIRTRHRSVIGDQPAMIVAVRNAAFGRGRRVAAAVGAPSRTEAMETCSAIRRAGGYCVVVRTGRS